mmetsp:Transcript_9052/g.26371  ORF Transcript_9052/g.26371 Transcript_9052/m.26371 type:complete len:261 (+) Transcript_9052:117-899(+)
MYTTLFTTEALKTCTGRGSGLRYIITKGVQLVYHGSFGGQALPKKGSRAMNVPRRQATSVLTKHSMPFSAMLLGQQFSAPPGRLAQSHPSHAPQMLSQQTVPSLFRMPLAHKSSAGAGGVGGGTKGMPRTAEHTAGASSMQETQKSKQHGRDEPVGNARQDGSQLQVPPPKMPPQNSPPRGVRLQAPDPESGANGFGKVASNVAGSVPQNSTPQEQVLTQPKSALKKSTATSQAPALAVMSAALQLGSAGLPGAPKTASH